MPRPRVTKLKAPTASRNTSVPHEPEPSKLRAPNASARSRPNDATSCGPSAAATRALKEASSKSNIGTKRTVADSRNAPEGVPTVEELLNEKFSSDSDHLVRKARFKPYSSSRLRDENDAPPIMSGGLGGGDMPKAHKEADKHNAVWQRVRKSMDSGKDPEVIQNRSPRMTGSQNYNLGVPRVGVESRPTSVVTQQTRPSGKDLRNERTPQPSQGTTEAGRRLLESAYDPPLDDVSELDLPAPGSEIRNSKTNAVERVTDSFPGPDAGNTAGPPSAAKGQATPSFLSMANFKRRPRQGSLLRMVQQDTGNVSEMDTTMADDRDEIRRFTLGHSSTDEASDLGETPNDHSSSARKRKADEFDQHKSAAESVPRISRNSHKQRKISPKIQEVSRARPSIEHASDLEARPPTRGKDKELKAAKAAKDTNARPRTSRPHRSTHSHKAPPRHRSSSPIDAPSPVSSPASSPPPQPLQTTKNPATRKNDTQKPSKKPPRITTAHLTALLPRRRTRGLRERAGGNRDDEFTILDTNSSEQAESEEQVITDDVPGEDEDEDDLARPSRLGRFANSRKSKATASAKGKGTSKKTPATKTKKNVPPDKSKSGNGTTKRARAGTLKSPKQVKSPNARGATSIPNKQAQSNQPKRTYGRQTLSNDGENENDDSRAFTPAEDEDIDVNDETTELHAEAQKQAKGKLKKPNVSESREMKEAAKKFAEVDEWDLDFESASLGVDSSPWR
ncbi:MAG: hypothetical protein M1831_005210 [Alyxoria varia]|nr:MAG: hypothetical protein M1831_005210 [Alyxoria varia]